MKERRRSGFSVEGGREEGEEEEKGITRLVEVEGFRVDSELLECGTIPLNQHLGPL